MIRAKFTPGCQDFLEKIGLSPDEVAATINAAEQDQRLARNTRFIAWRWFSADRILLVDGHAPQNEGSTADCRDNVEEVTAHVVLRLRQQLPAGRIERDMDLERVLATVAESFGLPLTCDPEEPLSTLYSGSGSKETMVVHTGCIPPGYWILGSFDPGQAYCELVWAFNPERYLAWLRSA